MNCRAAVSVVLLLWVWLGALRGQQATVIQGATIITVSGGTIENGSLVIRDGKIAALGPSLTIPEGARIIDAKGQYVLPGIIDCHSHMAVHAINESGVPVTSMVSIEDVLEPEDITIYRALSGGVTTANILHGSSNPIGGQCTVIKMRWGEDHAGLLLKGAPPGIKFALGENPKRDSKKLHPSTRHGVIDVIRQAFQKAKDYQREWREFETSGKSGKRALPPRRDMQLEPLVEILEGKRLVHAHCYRADEIIALLRLAEEIGFRIRTLQHVLEGYKVADEIAAHGAGASTFSDWWTYKVEAQDAIPYNAALMTRRGVLVSINSDSGEEVRHLNREAAKTIKWGGLSENEALKLITLNPAKQLGIGHRVGSIEAGKDADLAIWDKHPLSVYAKVVTTFIDGKIYFDQEQDRKRRKAIAEEKKALLAKEKEAEGKGQKPAAKPKKQTGLFATGEEGR